MGSEMCIRDRRRPSSVQPSSSPAQTFKLSPLSTVHVFEPFQKPLQGAQTSKSVGDLYAHLAIVTETTAERPRSEESGSDDFEIPIQSTSELNELAKAAVPRGLAGGSGLVLPALDLGMPVAALAPPAPPPQMPLPRIPQFDRGFTALGLAHA